jgi:hypothetical protein
LRIRITKRLTGSIDGIQLDRLKVGRTYEVATSLGTYLLCEQCAEAVFDQRHTSLLAWDDTASRGIGTAADRAAKPRARRG